MQVLLADDDDHRAEALMRVLAAAPGVHVARLTRGQLLADAVALHAPDVVIVDMGRPDRDALEGVRRVTQSDPRPIVMFVDRDDPDFMEEAITAGVCSYNVAGLPPPDMRPILRAAIALFRRHQQAKTDLHTAKTRVEERAVVDRAKALLIRERRMSEPDAYRWLRRRAMSTGRRIPDIAQELLHAALFLAPRPGQLPQPEALVPLLGSAVPERARPLLLSGRAPADADAGPRICACFGVARDAVRHAVVTHRLSSVAEIGLHLHAGTNCGSCIPELEEILRDVRVPV